MKKPDLTIFKYHFARGTWISIAWNWLLINVGRAAEGYLTLSVLYQGASLLPGVHTPASLDNTVFIGQQLALDVGGISLAKQSQQTRRNGQIAQANLERKVGFLLIGLMISNVILSQLRRFQIIPDPVVIVIEVLLLILRSIMAVVYGYIVYSPSVSEDAHVVRTSDIGERLQQFTEDLHRIAESTEARIQQSETNTERHLNSLADAIRSLATNTEYRIASVAEQVTLLGNATEYRIASTEGSIASLAEHIQSQMDAGLANLSIELAEQAGTLSVLSDLSLQMGRFEETARTEWRTVTEEVRVTVEQQMQALPKFVTQTPNTVPNSHRIVEPKPRNVVKPKASVVTPNSTEEFDKGEFVRQCLRDEPNVSIGAIQRKALEMGQKIAGSYVSEIRQKFTETQMTNVVDADTGEFDKITVGE